jgi:methoxymalonate biosynthesis acyl carrier protein
MSTHRGNDGGQATPTISVEDVRRSIRGFITSAIALPDLGDDTNLFESGIVNSLFAMQLLTFIEKTFRITAEQDDLDIENFKSVNAATAFVLRKNG